MLLCVTLGIKSSSLYAPLDSGGISNNVISFSLKSHLLPIQEYNILKKNSYKLHAVNKKATLEKLMTCEQELMFHKLYNEHFATRKNILHYNFFYKQFSMQF